MNLLITGGAGFVGRRTAESAKARGHKVTVTDVNKCDPFSGVTVESADILDYDRVLSLVDGHDAVIHCAAVVGPQRVQKQPTLAVGVNVTGTAHVLEAAKASSAAVVFLSTATLYGTRPDLEPIGEDTPPSPVGLYDATKWAAEILCNTYRDNMEVAVASVRTSFVYGPGYSTGEYFVEAALVGNTVAEANGRDHPCDFTYVSDLADGLILAAERSPLPRPAYNLSSGILRTRGEFAEAVRRVVPQADIRLGPGIDPKRHLRGPCLIERARADFGYEPRFTIESGVRDWISREGL